MNKSSFEYQTGKRLKKTAPGAWDVLDDGIRVGGIKGVGTDAVLIQSLFNEFWKARKKQVFDRDGYKCVECGSPFQIECDHIVNRSQRGNSSMENLATLCRKCHYDKTNLLGKWAVKRA